ncbi:MAG: CAP domain-containing protein [Cyanobacteria bacterium P01_A01_bin.83]
MSTQLINQVLELTNAERAKAGLNPLRLDNQLSQAAQGHSDSMGEDDFFSHTGADGSTAFDRIKDTGYVYSTAGENIAAGQRTAQQVVEGWMNSPGHRANILNADYTEIGIGYEFLENDTGSVNYNHYWTQVFGTPLGNNSTGGNNQPTSVFEPNNAPVAVEEDNNPEVDQLNTGNSDAPKSNQEPDLVPEAIEVTDNEPTPTKTSKKQGGELEDLPRDTQDVSNMEDLEADVLDVFKDSLTGQADSSNKDYSMDQFNDLMMVEGEDSVNFPDGSNSLDNSSDNFADYTGLVRNYSLGNSGFDLNDYKSVIMDYISDLDINPQQQQQIIENIESLF